MGTLSKIIFHLMIALIVFLLAALVLIIGIGIAGSKGAVPVSAASLVGHINDDVILSCTFTPDPSQDNDIKWEKVGMSGLVHKYQKGNNELTDQNPAFRGRTSLFLSQVMVGNASLKLSRVQLSDTGTYRCIISNSKGTGESKMVFRVGDFSTVTVTQVSNNSLNCDSPSWYPQPNVSWVSTSGTNLTNLTWTSFQPGLNRAVTVRSALREVQLDVQYTCVINTELARAEGDAMLTDSGLQTASRLEVFSSVALLSAPRLWLCTPFLSLLLGSVLH
ncbi:V-set domain-containing T-cell activation inhibitor 1 [Xenopus laevis]|uniref:V-set domain-containing T-cell activation inhibitor 1 n=2 Tax=Xenopus laevis TaxID=8355 RepID=A0A1L8HBS4_XENLA|nr:V-set domain-containing T-cell activation inhibitor 1 [Xenopus laevis]OCT93554.1 hypothetical protein XELAEV_18011232mg [Xenopus laevis]